MRPLYRAGQRDTCTVRSQPVVTPIHNETTCVNMVIVFAEWVHVCFEGYCWCEKNFWIKT